MEREYICLKKAMSVKHDLALDGLWSSTKAGFREQGNECTVP